MTFLTPRTLKRIRTIFKLIGLALVFDRLLLALEKTFLDSAKSEGDHESKYALVFNNRFKKSDKKRALKESQRQRLLSELNRIGLEAEQINSSYWNETGSSDISVYAVNATYDALVRFAQEMDLKKRTKKTGALVPFDASIGSKFAGFAGSHPGLFTPTEQQRITLFAMRSIRDSDGRELVSVAQHDGVLIQMFPLSDRGQARQILWLWSKAPGSSTAIQQVADYFGTEIAFSFVWLSAYTRFLWIPALAGLVVHLFASETADDIWTVAFAAIMPILGTVFLEQWKRSSNRLQFELGVNDLECFERPRPEYDPRVYRLPGTSLQLTPRLRKALVTAASLPVMVVLLFGTAAAMLVQFEVQGYLQRTRPDSVLVHVPSVVFGIALLLLNAAYGRVAGAITNLENHRTESGHRTALLTRQIVLTCTSSFMSLFYLLFWVQDLSRVRQQLAALLISSQLLGQFQEVGLPALNGLVRAVRSKKSAEELRRDRDRLRAGRRVSVDPQTGLRTVPAIEDDSAREPFPNTDDDYSEMIVQFGYVFLFGWSWPLAAPCALLNNVTEIRTDCFKLCMVMQKPEARQANSIGAWYYALEVITVGAVLTNTAYMFMRVCVTPDILLAGNGIGVKLGLVIALEHLVLFAKFALDYMIPDVPGDIRDQIRKQQVEFAREQARQLKASRSSAIVQG